MIFQLLCRRCVVENGSLGVRDGLAVECVVIPLLTSRQRPLLGVRYSHHNSGKLDSGEFVHAIRSMK